ncbi:phage gp6-like head-tail connector protein, partial [Clostridium perfringens]
MRPSLEFLKSYLRIDGSEDDNVLTLLLGAAKEYLRNAGVAEPESGPDDGKLYDLA